MKLAAKFPLTLRELVPSVLLLHEFESTGNRSKVSLFCKLLQYCTGTLNKYSLCLEEFMSCILVSCVVLIFQDTDLVPFDIMWIGPHVFFVESELKYVMYSMNYCPLSFCFHFSFKKFRSNSCIFTPVIRLLFLMNSYQLPL